MALGSASLTYVDYDGQKGQMNINIPTVTAANFAALNTNLDALKTATDAVTDGLCLASHITQPTLYAGQTATSSNPDSQRGNKWAVSYIDASAELAAGVPNPYYRKPFTVEIPTADFDLRYGGQNVVYNFGSATNPQEWLDWVNAFELVAKSPVGGNVNVELVEAVTISGG
jgi:hypothetical protein